MGMPKEVARATGKEPAIERIKALDLAKRTFKCCTLTAEKNFQDRTITPGNMDPAGRAAFASTLRAGDLVVMEGGTSSYNFARELMQNTQAEVIVLNPAKLHIIYESQCKTDKQDAVKLARYIRDTNRENWVTLAVPTKDETDLRSILNAYASAKEERTRSINQLHAIFNQNGYPMLRKSSLASNEGRLASIDAHLDKESPAYIIAITIEWAVTSYELDIELYRKMMRETLLKHPKETIIWMSIPGIGLITAASLLAYIGDGSRFFTPAQLRNYIALVPRIDQSGSRCIVGRLSSFGCKPVRRNIIQGALSIEKLKSDCPLKEAWQKLAASGKRRQLIGVKIANKMITIGWTLLRKGELYNGFGNYSLLNRKLKEAGLDAIDRSMFKELN